MQTTKPKVILGLSGGVDSSVSAYLLQQAGFEVIPFFLKLYSDTKNEITGDCSYLDDLKDARKICSKLNLNLIILDKEEEYKSQVLKPMFKSYQHNKTPNPDLACNSIIKFPFLEKVSKKYKADYIATGHYARIKKVKDKFYLLTGKDTNKDQSYFLAQLTENQLSKIIFPLGNMKKEQVRQLAEKLNFPNAQKHGTTGICFVGKQNMPNFLKKKIKFTSGPILDEKGNQIGIHNGIESFTIGQKLGEHLNISLHKPNKFAQLRWYVADKKGNKLIAVPENHPLLYKKEVDLFKLHLINKKDKVPSEVKVRIRHLGIFFPGRLIKKSNHYQFKFNKPIKDLCPGQYLVFYDKDKVLGSGEIK